MTLTEQSAVTSSSYPAQSGSFPKSISSKIVSASPSVPLPLKYVYGTN